MWEQDWKERVLPRLAISEPEGCWLWTGPMSPSGYGIVSLKINGRWETRRVHRIAVEFGRGVAIPVGLTVDHLCRTRNCENPAHLEVVSNRTNVLRGIGITAKNATKTHCSNGHELSGENLYVRTDGRACLTCRRETTAKWNAIRQFKGPRAKINFRDAEEIRLLRANGTIVAELAFKYGINKRTVRNVLNGDTWKKEATSA